MSLTYTMRDSAGGQFRLRASTGPEIEAAGELIAGDQSITVRATDGNGWLRDTTYLVPVPQGAIPSWVRADLGIDWTGDRGYYNGVVYNTAAAALTAMGAVYTRSGVKPYINASGVRVEAAAGVLPIEYDPATLQPLGPSFWPALTPRNLWGRDWTNAVWTHTNVTAAKTATGLDGAANAATLLTATAANATSLQAITDAVSRNRGLALYIKRVTGSGAISITADGGATWVDITEWLRSDRYARVNTYVVGTTNPSVGVKIATSGDQIQVDYLTLCDTIYTGPPLLTTGTVQSVSADVLYIPMTAVGVSKTQGAIMYRSVNACDRNGGGGENRYAFSISDGTTSNVLMEAGPTNMPSGTPGLDGWDIQRQSYRYARRWSSDGFQKSAIEGVIGNSAAITLNPSISRVYIGCRSNGFNQAGAWMQEFWLKSTAPTDVELAALASSKRQWLGVGDSLSIQTAATLAYLGYAHVARTRVAEAPRTFVRKGLGGSVTDGLKPDESVDVSAKAQYLANKDLYPGSRLLVWTGHNNAGTDTELWSRVIPFYQWIDEQTSGGCLYFTLIVTYDDQGTIRETQKKAANAWLKANMPASRVFDIQGYLVANGSDGSANDVADAAAGLAPRSCLGDVIHLSNRGSYFGGIGLADHINIYGW
jgi:hypothetical protein